MKTAQLKRDLKDIKVSMSEIENLGTAQTNPARHHPSIDDLRGLSSEATIRQLKEK